MRRLLNLLLVSAVVAILLPQADAHTKRWYLNGAKDVLQIGVLDCGDGSDPVLNQSFGGFCFGSKGDGTLPDDYPSESDCQSDASGTCFIATSVHPTLALQGTYCQDLNGDFFCGGAIGEPADAITEPHMEFCFAEDGFQIKKPLDPTPRGRGIWQVSDPATTWATNNWDPGHAVAFFLFGPGFHGNPPPNGCGFTFSGVVGNGCHGSSFITGFDCSFVLICIEPLCEGAGQKH